MDQIDRVPGITGSEDKNPDLNSLCDDMRNAGMRVTRRRSRRIGSMLLLIAYGP
jgi:hypothetical protein